MRRSAETAFPGAAANTSLKRGACLSIMLRHIPRTRFGSGQALRSCCQLQLVRVSASWRDVCGRSCSYRIYSRCHREEKLLDTCWGKLHDQTESTITLERRAEDLRLGKAPQKWPLVVEGLQRRPLARQDTTYHIEAFQRTQF